MKGKAYGIFSAHHQRWWSRERWAWVVWGVECSTFPTIEDASRYIAERGWVNTTVGTVPNGAYVVFVS